MMHITSTEPVLINSKIHITATNFLLRTELVTCNYIYFTTNYIAVLSEMTCKCEQRLLRIFTE